MTITLLDRPTPVHDDASRRQFLIGGATLAALLAGCNTSAPAPGATPDMSGFPVTVEHKYGSTTINGRADRVVTVG